MTVKELIDILSTMPQNYEVVYALYSDYARLEPRDIDVQNETDQLVTGSIIAHHNRPGEFRCYRKYEYKGLPLPKPANVVSFPA